jgi:hypothetical protein
MPAILVPEYVVDFIFSEVERNLSEKSLSLSRIFAVHVAAIELTTLAGNENASNKSPAGVSITLRFLFVYPQNPATTG